MKKMARFICFFIFCIGGLTACMNESKTAMIDVNAIVNSGPHAQAAATQLKEAQEIYQYNLNVIEAILSGYKNKEQSRAYLIEAARQLQAQLDRSKLLVTQSLLNALNAVLNDQKQVYDLIIKKDGIIYVKKADGGATDTSKAMPEDITSKIAVLYAKTAVTFPPLPRVVERPTLPADLGEGVPFPPENPSESPQEKEGSDAELINSKDTSGESQ